MERIGFIGLGTMGSSMAANLQRAGHPLTVWNRTPGREGALVEQGAAVAPSPSQLAASSDVVVICVSDTPDVEAVLFGRDGVYEGVRPGSLVIDCSTISPSATREFGRRLLERETAMVDAPVSGGPEGAKHATLTIFVGGDNEAVGRARPILEKLGRTITHLGPLGSGQVAKAVNQVMICGAYLSVAEGIILGERAGLDGRKLVEALSSGAAQSWVLANRSGRMLDREYPLGFRLALHLKDLRIALELADQEEVDLPVATLTAAFEERLMARARGGEDMSVLAEAIREPGSEAPFKVR